MTLLEEFSCTLILNECHKSSSIRRQISYGSDITVTFCHYEERILSL